MYITECYLMYFRYINMFWFVGVSVCFVHLRMFVVPLRMQKCGCWLISSKVGRCRLCNSEYTLEYCMYYENITQSPALLIHYACFMFGSSTNIPWVCINTSVDSQCAYEFIAMKPFALLHFLLVNARASQVSDLSVLEMKTSNQTYTVKYFIKYIIDF